MPWLPEVQALDVVMTRPVRPKNSADVHRRGVAHHLDVAGRVDASRVASAVMQLGEVAARPPACRRTSRRRRPPRPLQQRLAEQAGVGQRQLGGAHRHQRDAAHGARLLARIAVGRSNDRRSARPAACSGPRSAPTRACAARPLRRPRRCAPIVGQSLPSAVTPPMPVTTTRRITPCPRSPRSPGA